MGKTNRRIHPIPLRLLLGALILPLLVGFGYPDSTGTYAGISAGGGRYRFSPACSHYTYGVDFQEAEVSLQHRMATEPAQNGEGVIGKIKPGHVTFGLNGDFLNKQITVLAWDSASTDDASPGPGSPPAGDPQVGSRRDAMGYAVGARIGLAWKWIGATAGVSALSYSRGSEDGEEETGRIPSVLPILGLRVGDEDLIYASAEMLGSSPIASGGGIISYGLGGKWRDNRLWAGVGAVPFEKTMATLKASRSFGPLNLSLGMSARGEDFLKFEDYAASLGLGYRLPWN